MGGSLSRWQQRPDVPRGDAYDSRWERLAAAGESVHGEADLVWHLVGHLANDEPEGRPRVLDAGCGTGRVAVELARRGAQVVGVDLDRSMLNTARAKSAEVRWVEADLAALDLRDEGDAIARGIGAGGTGEGDTGAGDTVEGNTAAGERLLFDAAVMAGNVMIFVEPHTEAAVLRQIALHVEAGGAVIAGFQLGPGRLRLVNYDRYATEAGLELEVRYATWEQQPYTGGDYAVSVHRRI